MLNLLGFPSSRICHQHRWYSLQPFCLPLSFFQCFLREPVSPLSASSHLGRLSSSFHGGPSHALFVPSSRPQRNAWHVLNSCFILCWISLCLPSKALAPTEPSGALSAIQQNSWGVSQDQTFGEQIFSLSLLSTLATRLSCHRIKMATSGSWTYLSFKFSGGLSVGGGRRSISFPKLARNPRTCSQ